MAPFQKWLNGDDSAMTDDELEGAMLFFDKGQCYTCHSGPGLNGMGFHALGMADLAGENILTVIKIPQLYNLKDVKFFGHGGSFNTVKEVITYKNDAQHENIEISANKLSELFVPLDLTEDEIDLITLFVEKSLYDSNLMRYQPSSLPSGNCFPDADAQASEDMGCI